MYAYLRTNLEPRNFSFTSFYDSPNISFQGHYAIAEYEKKHGSQKITVITQNVDGLHGRAGSVNLIELHGNLYKTRCTKCKEVLVNNDSPICEVT